MKIKNIIILTLNVLIISCSIKEESKVNKLTKELMFTNPLQGFISEKPASKWEESLISGNGTIGIMMPGNPLQDRIVFSHERLFMPEYHPYKAPNLGSRLAELRKEIFAGNNAKGIEIMEQEAKKVGIDGMVWTNPLIPACQLELQSISKDSVGSFARSTNFDNGEILVAYKQGDNVFQRRGFVSRKDKIAAIKFTSPTNGKLNYKFVLGQLPVKKGTDFDPNQFVSVVNEAASSYLHYGVEFKKRWKGSLIGYDLLVKILSDGGETKVNGDTVIINNSNSITLLTDIKLKRNSSIDGYSILKNKLDSLNFSYEELLKRHSVIHSEIFNRFSLKLGKGNSLLKTSEELQASSNVDKTNTKLIEQLVKAARYNAISSAGELPPTLQGIWGGTWRPAWSSDFTLNGNVPSAIASGLNTNLIELTDAFINLMEEMKPDFEKNAKELYGIDGIFVPSRASDNGSVYHFGKHWPHLYWFAGGAWVSHFYYDRWLYTSDTTFLKRKAIPFMQESFNFLSKIVYKTKEDKYIFIPSYSPENAPQGVSETAINATMDVAAFKQLLRNLITLSNQGFIDKSKIKVYLEYLNNLPNDTIDENGELKEWIWPSYRNNNAHRHISQLYPLYDGIDPEFENSVELRKAAIKTIEKRLEYRRGKNGGEMAFGLVLAGISAAHLKDTTHAYECVRWLCNSYWTNAFVSYHDPGKIFNLDISGGLPAIISYMLLQSSLEKIEILPCLPKEMNEGKVTGLPARGGFLIDMSWENGKVNSLTVKSLSGNKTDLIYNNWHRTIKIKKNESITFKF